MLFSNFKNDPSTLQRHKNTSYPEISKLLTLSLDKMNVCLSFGTKYVGTKINVLRKILNFSHVHFLFLVSIDKTKIIVFRRGGKIKSKEKRFPHGKSVEIVALYKYLGVYFTPKMSCSFAIDKLSLQIKNSLFVCFKM